MTRVSAFRFALALSAGFMIFQGCTGPSKNGDQPAQTAAATAQSTSAVDSPLKALQGTFRPTYDAARDFVDANLSPFVVVRLSDLFLIKDGMVIAEAKGIPRKYHLLHRTAHVPFVIYLKINRFFGSPLPGSVSSELAEYRRLIDPSIADLTNSEYSFTTEEIADQEFILRSSAAYLDRLATEVIASREAFSAYRVQVAGAMMKLADAAGAAQVDATHAVMLSWKEKLTIEEWIALRVLIIGFRQPRHDYAATQYFSSIFPDRSNSLFPGESDRVVYIEASSIDRTDKSFKEARKSLAALLLDSEASQSFFNNRYRMSIDVMADGARRRIGELDLSALQPRE